MEKQEISRIIENVVSGLYSSTVPEVKEDADINSQDNVRRIVVGSDHGGFEAKEMLKTYLKSLGYRVTDVGTDNEESVDYPDFAVKVAKKVASGECDRGIMIDGAGIGSSMTCNKVKGIRAALCFNEFMAEMSKRHNNANVLVLGARVIGTDLALRIVEKWLETDFEGGRHQRRLDKISQLEDDFLSE